MLDIVIQQAQVNPALHFPAFVTDPDTKGLNVRGMRGKIRSNQTSNILFTGICLQSQLVSGIKVGAGTDEQFLIPVEPPQPENSVALMRQLTGTPRAAASEESSFIHFDFVRPRYMPGFIHG